MNELLEIFKDFQFNGFVWQILAPLIFSLADIITGYIQALINNNVDSKKMRVGLWHKALITIVIALSFVIQFAFNLNHITSVVGIYVIVMEIVSILENLQKAGVPLGKFANLLKDEKEKEDEI